MKPFPTLHDDQNNIYWLQELASEEVADTQEGGERLLEQFAAQRDSTLDACASTIGEGKALLEEIKAKAEADTTGSVTAVTAALDRLATQRDDLADLWTTRKMRLDLCLQVGQKLPSFLSQVLHVDLHLPVPFFYSSNMK